MKHRRSRFSSACRLALASLALIPVALLSGGCGSDSESSVPNKFTRANLVSDVAGFSDSAGAASHTDPNLKNPWGVTFSPAGPFWVADNATGKVTLYNSSGTPQALVVSVSAPGGGPGAVTGQVFNSTSNFPVGGTAAVFILSTEDGTIVAWATGTTASIVVNNSATGAIYKGLAIGSNATGNFLYAANFNSGKIDVFSGSFAPATLTGSFTDPNLPAGYAPFNIANIGGSLYVAYAKQDAAKKDDVAGAGNGLVDVFDTNGNLVRRLITGSGAGGAAAELNAPWGLAIAPNSFGPFGGALLIGNFGDGRITAVNPTTGAVLGQLQTAAGAPITISGLWALTFGNGGSGGNTGTLYFSAGINGEQDGLFGSIAPSP